MSDQQPDADEVVHNVNKDDFDYVPDKAAIVRISSQDPINVFWCLTLLSLPSQGTIGLCPGSWLVNTFFDAANALMFPLIIKFKTAQMQPQLALVAKAVGSVAWVGCLRLPLESEPGVWRKDEDITFYTLDVISKFELVTNDSYGGKTVNQLDHWLSKESKFFAAMKLTSYTKMRQYTSGGGRFSKNFEKVLDYFEKSIRKALREETGESGTLVSSKAKGKVAAQASNVEQMDERLALVGRFAVWAAENKVYFDRPLEQRLVEMSVFGDPRAHDGHVDPPDVLESLIMEAMGDDPDRAKYLPALKSADALNKLATLTADPAVTSPFKSLSAPKPLPPPDPPADVRTPEAAPSCRTPASPGQRRSSRVRERDDVPTKSSSDEAKSPEKKVKIKMEGLPPPRSPVPDILSAAEFHQAVGLAVCEKKQRVRGPRGPYKKKSSPSLMAAALGMASVNSPRETVGVRMQTQRRHTAKRCILAAGAGRKVEVAQIGEVGHGAPQPER